MSAKKAHSSRRSTKPSTNCPSVTVSEARLDSCSRRYASNGLVGFIRVSLKRTRTFYLLSRAPWPIDTLFSQLFDSWRRHGASWDDAAKTVDVAGRVLTQKSRSRWPNGSQLEKKLSFPPFEIVT